MEHKHFDAFLFCCLLKKTTYGCSDVDDSVTLVTVLSWWLYAGDRITMSAMVILVN